MTHCFFTNSDTWPYSIGNSAVMRFKESFSPSLFSRIMPSNLLIEVSSVISSIVSSVTAIASAPDVDLRGLSTFLASSSLSLSEIKVIVIESNNTFLSFLFIA